MGPKLLARQTRVSALAAEAMTLASPDWALLAAQYSYADQAHLAREFRELTTMSRTPDSRAVRLACAHVEAWAKKDFETARNGLATSVRASQSSTMPDTPRHDLVGVEDYMQGLIMFAQSIVPGSVRVTDSNGDDSCALLMVTTPVNGPPFGKLTIHNSRLYRFDENDKIAVEQVLFYTVPG